VVHGRIFEACGQAWDGPRAPSELAFEFHYKEVDMKLLYFPDTSYALKESQIGFRLVKACSGCFLPLYYQRENASQEAVLFFDKGGFRLELGI
jgi:hypothetical protein